VFNLSKSFLRYSISVPADAGHCNAILLGIPPIRRLSLSTRGGQYLADINNFQEFWKMTKNLVTPTEVFNSYPSLGFGNTLAAAQLSGLCLHNNPSNALPATVSADGVANATKKF
jgi:hypothetical protein